MITKEEIEREGLELFEDTIPYSLEFQENLPKWELFEGANDPQGIVDNVNILGRAVGPFFVVDGKSQNNRFYSRALWERILKESQETIRRGAMLCTMGHGQVLDDSAMLEGKISHRVSKLWIDENKGIGMGELLIMNTVAGRNLNTYMRSGVECPVSSRGYGKYASTMEDGTRIIDSDTYKLEGFDVVRVPGIPGAVPRLVESKELTQQQPQQQHTSAKDTHSAVSENTKANISDTSASVTLSPRANDEQHTAQTDEALSSSAGFDKEYGNNTNTNNIVKKNEEGAQQQRSPQQTQVHEQENVKSSHRKGMNIIMEDTVLTKITEEKIRLEESLRQALETNARLQETIGALKGQVDEYQTTLGSYRQLGTTEDLSRVLDVTETMLHNRPVEESDFVQLREALEIYEELGTPEELEQLFDKFETFMNQYEDLGTPADLDKALDTSAQLLEGYSELGSPLDINEAFDSVEAFMGEMGELGTVAELHAVCDLLEAYQEYGTPTELRRSFDMMNALVDNTTQQHIKTEGKIMSVEYGVDQLIAENMIVAMGSARARETLGAINESRSVTSRYIAPSRTSTNNKNEDQTGHMNEDGSYKYSAVSQSLFDKSPTSRGRRLIDKMSR